MSDFYRIASLFRKFRTHAIQEDEVRELWEWMKAEENREFFKQMMDGEKWNTFVLQLSFIGWYLLCSVTFGIGFIFLEPYVQATFAELYAALRAKALANGYTNEYELGGFVRH